MSKCIHMVKLSVGTESIEGLIRWQAMARAQGPDGAPRHVTRMWPKQESALLNGGSIFWVIKGFIQCRQRIMRLDEMIGQDGIRRCAIVLDPELVHTTNATKRPFQGWRYLKPDDAPIDLSPDRKDEDHLPVELAGALADIGIL
jgi:hypothetical protein